MVYCCACGLDLHGIFYPETHDLDEEEIAQLYSRERLPEWQLEWTASGFCTANDESFTGTRNHHIPLYRRGLRILTTLTGKKVEIMNCRTRFENDLLLDITDPESFFPIHVKCLSLVDHFMSRKADAQPNNIASGLQNIYKFYRNLDRLRQLVGEDPYGIVGKGIEWPHGYYGARRFWFDSWTMEPGWEFLVADPLNIPDLMEYLFSNLDVISITDDHPSEVMVATSAAFRDGSCTGLEALPVELLDKITSQLCLHSILNLRRTSRALFHRIYLDQRFWRDQLVSLDIVPFLWNLDIAAYREKDSAVPEGMCWDWRRLIQNISHEPFVELALKDAMSGFSADDMGYLCSEFWRRVSEDKTSKLRGNPPLGLINRIRIMKIINEAVELAQST